MTTEEKARAYDEALEWMRGVYPTLTGAAQEDAVHFFPELAGGEDERIRKFLIDILSQGTWRKEWPFGPNKVVAWLERQSQTQSDTEKEYVRTLQSLIMNFLHGKDEVDRDYYQQISDWLEERHVEQKVQRPTFLRPHNGNDNNHYDMGVFEAQTYAINRGLDIPFNDGEVFIDDRYMTQTVGNILRWADEHPKEQNFIQTKDEKEYIRTIKSLIADFIRDKKPEDVAYYQRIYNWLDGRHIEQKPVEWSKEDEKMKESIIKALYGGGQFAYEPEIDWLKSLKDKDRVWPKQEWNEEDEKIRKTLLDYYEVALDNYTCVEWLNGITYGELCDWLKSLRPSWKPSEEQMQYLLAVINDPNNIGAESCYLTLKSLYDDLKKLM